MNDITNNMERLLRYAEFETGKTGLEISNDLGLPFSQQYYRLKKKRSKDLQVLVDLHTKVGLPWDKLIRVLMEEYSNTEVEET